MDFNYFFDDNINTIFIQKTYGKLMLTVGFMIVCALQLDIVVGNFYGQTACLVVGMVFIKLAHLATHAGIGKAAQIEYARVRHQIPFSRFFAPSTLIKSST